MNNSEKIKKNADELSKQASELYNILNTLNFHTPKEAADDLKHSAGALIRGMKQRVRYIHQALIGELGARGVPPGAEEELTAMSEYLDTLRHCSGDSRSHQHLLSVLIPLMELLKKWAEAGVNKVSFDK